MSALPTNPPSQAPEPETVAVIVVHGVADQAPNESARAIAALLSSQNSPTRQKYKIFEEDNIRIDVAEPQSSGGETQTFYVRAKRMSQKGGKDSSPESAVSPGINCADDPGIVMMHDQLQGYVAKGDDATYRTVRLAAERQAGGTNTRVHIYEMYWADLSRVGSGLLRIFGEVYQLLLHVPSLGRHAVDAAGISDGRDNSAWQRLIERQRWAAYFLTVPIPLLNLWMFGSLLIGLTGPLVVAKLSDTLKPLPAVLVIGLAATIYLATTLPRRDLPLPVWSVVPLALLGTAIALYVLMQAWHLSFAITALVAVAGLWAGGSWLLARYSRTQPDARKFGRVSLILVVLGLVAGLLFTQPNEDSIMTAAFHVIEVLYVAAGVAWLVFFVSQLLALYTGWRARRLMASQLSDEDSKRRFDRLQRAERTASLTLAIPAVSFIVITMVLWAGLHQVLEQAVETKGYSSWVLRHLVTPEEEKTLTEHSNAAWQMILLSTPELIVLLALVGLAIVLALWATLPVVISEVRPPAEVDDPRRLGQWLNRGFDLLALAGTVLIVACILVMPVVAAHLVFRYQGTAALGHSLLTSLGVEDKLISAVTSAMSEKSAGVLGLLGTLVAGTAVGLFAFGGRLKMLTGGVRPVLDVLLDVDNYLREHPLDNNPRSRIFARYVALLRHISTWRDAENRPYQSVVIVAHSQGTVITVDLLRYLCCYQEASLTELGKTIPVKLLTMGSPLRQLYGLRFPHFYAWARHLDPAAEAAASAFDIPPGRLPDPSLFKAKTWVNVYRSGDYVGRHLWRIDVDLSSVMLPGPASESPRKHVSIDDKGLRREYCVGAGAHTHYWDGTAPLVAEALDDLI